MLLAAVACVAATPSFVLADTVTVHARADATLLPPLVAFRLRDGAGRPLAAAADDLLGDLPVVAVLDTGASAHLLSHDTAARLGVHADPGARWMETGMAGEHAFAVSTPYTIAVVAGDDAEGSPHGARGPRAREAPSLLLTGQRLLVNDVPATAAAALASPGAVVDVIGMPAIASAVVEIVPDGDTATPVPGAALVPTLTPAAVSFASPEIAVRADHWLPLTLVDFSRHHHLANRGAPPTLASNPVFRAVRVARAGRSAEGDWLLDTGSAVTIVSTATARALGLTGQPPLSAPVGGISGAQQALSGWRVDRIELATTTGIVAITDAAVFVHDVTTVADDGTRITLDGIVGANLLDAFARVVLDVAHARVGVDLRP